MKLLDLQTGKYLELGENWGYFGNQILIISNEDEELSVEKWLDAIEFNEIEKCDYNMLDIKHHTNPIINQIAEKVGAVIYGGRYVLLENAIYKNKNITMGDTMEIDTTGIAVKSMILMINMCIFDDDFCSELNIDTLLQSKHIGNIFEEFSKKEQGIENKFDELNNLI